MGKRALNVRISQMPLSEAKPFGFDDTHIYAIRMITLEPFPK